VANRRSRLADGRFDAAQLVQMMAHVDDVEAAPLIGAKGTEEVVGGDSLETEALAALVEERIHLIDLLA
jgi:hypothetical protein